MLYLDCDHMHSSSLKHVPVSCCILRFAYFAFETPTHITGLKGVKVTANQHGQPSDSALGSVVDAERL